MITTITNYLMFSALIYIFGWGSGLLNQEETTRNMLNHIGLIVAFYLCVFLRVHRLVKYLRASMSNVSGKNGTIGKFVLAALAAFGAIFTYHWTTVACAAMQGSIGRACVEGISPVVWITCVSFGLIALLKATQLAPCAGRIIFRRILA